MDFSAMMTMKHAKADWKLKVDWFSGSDRIKTYILYIEIKQLLKNPAFRAKNDIRADKCGNERPAGNFMQIMAVRGLSTRNETMSNQQ